MTKPILPAISADTTLSNARSWLNILRFRESGTVIQIQDDCEYRITEILENKTILRSVLGPYYKKYLLSYFPAGTSGLTERIHDTLVSLAVHKRIATRGTAAGLSNRDLVREIGIAGFDIGLFVSHITPAFLETHADQLAELEQDIRTSKNLSVILFAESDILHPDLHRLADKCSFMYDHVIRYPLYGEADSSQFLRYYLNEWDISLPQRTQSEILHLCGGYLWLIHHLARYLRDHPDASLEAAVEDDVLDQKIRTVWNKLSQPQKHIIRKTYFKTLSDGDRQSHDFAFLKSMGFITASGTAATVGIPLLHRVMDTEISVSTWQTRRNGVFIGSRDISGLFTKKELRVFACLLEAKLHTVSREKIAQALWGTLWEEKYSDWAIDRIIYRIRTKLKTVNKADSLLKTVKKKGFIFG